MSSADCGGGSARCRRFSCTFTRVPCSRSLTWWARSCSARLPVRGVLAGSEAFPLGEQERFEQEFGIKVAHWYGHSEYAVLAYLLPGVPWLSLLPHLRSGGAASPRRPQGCRRVVASSFNRIGTQFVRYDTGDLAVAPTGSCAADHFPRADAIVGRSQETFVDSSGRRRALGPYLFGIHGPFWDQVRDLQVVQDRPGLLRVRFVANPGADRDQIELTLLRRIPMARLEFEYVPVIARSPSGEAQVLRGRLARGCAAVTGEPDRREAPRGRHEGPAHLWLTAAALVTGGRGCRPGPPGHDGRGGHPVTIRAHHAATGQQVSSLVVAPHAC